MATTGKRPGGNSLGLPRPVSDPNVELNLQEILRLNSDLDSRVGTVTGYIAATVSSGTLTLHYTEGSTNYVTLSENVTTVSFPSEVVAGKSYVLAVRQDGTGNRTVTGWSGNFLWPGGSAPTFSTAASAIDIVTFMAISFSGTTYLCGVGQYSFS